MKRVSIRGAVIAALTIAVAAGSARAQASDVDITPYGTACGPVLSATETSATNTRSFTFRVISARPGATVNLFLGLVRADLALGLGACRANLIPVGLIALGTANAQGNATFVIPGVPSTALFNVKLQAAVADTQGLQTTNGVEVAMTSRAPYTFTDMNHILSTGQSNAVGTGSTAISLTQPFANETFSSGVRGAATTLLVPLTETTVETHSSGMANLITMLARTAIFSSLPVPQNSHELIATTNGEAAQPYSALKRTTPAYQKGIGHVTNAKAIAQQRAKSYAVRAIALVHGESDHYYENQQYDLDLAEWQSDYETDIQQITGQSTPIPMLQTQISSWTYYTTLTTSPIPALQTKACVDNPGKLVMVGPRYHLSHADGEHLTSSDFRRMGEYYAKVYTRVVLERRTWEPVRPAVVTLQGNVITAVFHVPSPPLVLDTTRVSDPGNYGFEYTDTSAAPPSIVDVTVASPTVVRITLSAAPQVGATKHLRYAHTGTQGAPAGPTTGPRGNLRDSDATPSRHNYELFNWALHFEHEVK